MATTDYLGLALTGADENTATFKEWRQQINGTSSSNMIKIDSGVKAVNDALATKADAEGDWTLLETVTTSSAVSAVQCSKSFSGKGIMACCVFPTGSISSQILFTANNYWIGMGCGSSSGTYSCRFIVEDDHGVYSGSCQGNISGWGSGTLKGINSAGTFTAFTTLTSAKMYTADGKAAIPSGTKISFYYRA